AAPAQTPAFDGGAIVRRTLRVTGGGVADADASALSVVDARRRATLAVDSAASYVAEAIAGDDGFRVRLDVQRATPEERDAALQRAIEAGGRLVLLIDRPDVDAPQRELVELAAQQRPDAVVVNVGLAAQRPLPLPVVDVTAASRAGAEAARALLLGS